MEADCSVELGAEDERLEVPWTAPEGRPRYYDLKHQPELLLEIEEAHHNPELGEFLSAINSPASMLETAKCDTWVSDQITPEEEIYGAAWKFVSYVDLLFSDDHARTSFECHENFSRRIIRLLHKAPEISAAAEFAVRRCYYFRQAFAAGAVASPLESDDSPREGFYFTFYLSGYGDDEDEARCRWAIGLKLVENAILQLSATHRRGADQTAPELREG